MLPLTALVWQVAFIPHMQSCGITGPHGPLGVEPVSRGVVPRSVGVEPLSVGVEPVSVGVEPVSAAGVPLSAGVEGPVADTLHATAPETAIRRMKPQVFTSETPPFAGLDDSPA